MSHNQEVLPVIDVEEVLTGSERAPAIPQVRMMALEQFPEGQNALKLEGVSSPEEVVAAQVFNSLSYLARTLLDQDRNLRQGLASNPDSVQFPTVQVDQATRYSFRWLMEDLPEINEARESFTFYRDDISGVEGGFTVRKALGRYEVAPLDYDDYNNTEHASPETMLKEASVGVVRYAQKQGIKPENLYVKSESYHLGALIDGSLIRQAKKESRLIGRSIDRAKNCGQSLGRAAIGVFTRPSDNGLERLVNKKRVVAATLLATSPISGFALTEAATFIYDQVTSPPDLTAEQKYDQSNLDIPNVDPLAMGEHSIQYASYTSDQSRLFTLDPEFKALLAKSPKQVMLRENIDPGLCQLLPIDSSQANKHYSLVTTSRLAQDILTVEPTEGGVFVCNKSARFVTSTQASLVFDS